MSWLLKSGLSEAQKVDLETPYGCNVEIFLRYWVIFDKKWDSGIGEIYFGPTNEKFNSVHEGHVDKSMILSNRAYKITPIGAKFKDEAISNSVAILPG